MLTRYRSAMSRLPVSDQKYLSRYFGLDPRPPLFDAAQAARLMQADLVLALLRGERIAAVEALMGHPIRRTHPTPDLWVDDHMLRDDHITYAQRLLSTITPTPQAAADSRTIVSVEPNPRLPTTPSWGRFRELLPGRTLAQAIARGVTRKDIREALAARWLVVA